MNDVVPRTDSLIVRDVGDEILVLDTQSQQIHQLNPTASFVWRMYCGGATVTAIASALANAFDVEEATALVDVTNVLSRLRDLSLLRTDKRCDSLKPDF